VPTCFSERFARASAIYGPLVLGADPSGAVLTSWGLGDDVDGLERFVDRVLEVAPGAVGVVKPQSAFYERHGWRGVRALERLVAGARGAGLLVVLDAKRGDVGSTNAAYADAYLGTGAPLESDALTVHPYLGLAAMGDLVERAHAAGSCLFVVTRSSNLEGRALQTAVDASGASVEASLLAEIGRLNTRLAPGALGPVGAVVGPSVQAPLLDLVGAHALYLVPGVGAQGGSPADVARVFAACPERVLVSASRSLLAAGPDPHRLRDAAMALADELRGALGL
jgi:orotidine-5'-phosphate decarboxylase